MSEYEEQCAVVKFVERQYPKLAPHLVSSLNGVAIGNFKTKQGRVQGAIRIKREKKAGMKVGWPDLSLSIPSEQYHGLYIEMKKQGGVPSDLSDEQKFYIESIHALGYCCVWCAGADEAIEVIKDYLANKIIPTSGKVARTRRKSKSIKGEKNV